MTTMSAGPTSADESRAQVLLPRGDLRGAKAMFEVSAAESLKAGDWGAWSKAVVAQARACLASGGGSCEAIELLERALAKLPKGGAADAEFRLRVALGDAYSAAGRLPEAEGVLRVAEGLAEGMDSDAARAEVAVEWATVKALLELRAVSAPGAGPGQRGLAFARAEPEGYAAVVRMFEKGVRLAQGTGRAEIELGGLLRLAQVRTLCGESAAAAGDLRQAGKLLEGRESGGAGRHWLARGMIHQAIAREPGLAAAALAEAEGSFQRAAALGMAEKDWTVASFATGLRGRLLEEAGDWPGAERLTGEALFFAQRSGNLRALFEWQWQAARILLARGKLSQSKDYYKMAAESFRKVRTAFRSGRRGLLEYESNPGEAFFELANLNFKLADATKGRAEQNQLLLEARDAVEAYKSFEVESQFLNAECSALLENLSATIEQVLESGGSSAAVVYVLPLADRTELLVTLPGRQQERRTVHKGRAAIEAEAQVLLKGIESAGAGGPETVAAATTLYNDLIKPLEGILPPDRIRHLVFVLDGALARIPMAALHDGKEFLIEKYAVSNSPALALVEPGRTRTAKPRVLLGGLTTAEPMEGTTVNWPVLNGVEAEVREIASHFDGVALTGEDFSEANLSRELAGKPFNFVHLATHATFGGTPESTFALVRGGKLSLDRIGELLRPTLLRESPVEMLAFSACESARGDQRLELGLAGVALKSGARSVLATLWSVDDRSMVVLMSGFYKRLAEDPSTTKAEALRQAQLDLLRNPEFSSPYFWAPCILVGNWL